MTDKIYTLSVIWFPYSNIIKTNESVIGVFDSVRNAKTYMVKHYIEYLQNKIIPDYVIISYAIRESEFNCGFGIDLGDPLETWMPIRYPDGSRCILKSDKEVIGL